MQSYIAIDLKSFYASVECIERGLDPLTTNLVVADLSRTEKTIYIAPEASLTSRTDSALRQSGSRKTACISQPCQSHRESAPRDLVP